MFTGLVTETGRIARVEPRAGGRRIWVEARKAARGAKVGDSIAVNGCCLTVAELGSRRTEGRRLCQFDLLEETCRVTNLGEAAEGTLVNLEASLAAGDPLGGHFVTGHVDATGRVARWEPDGGDYLLEVECPKAVRPWLAPKGCIAVDGISLTVAKRTPRGFVAWIIPHTLSATNLSAAKPGARVNLEGDLIAKYVTRLIPNQRPRRQGL